MAYNYLYISVCIKVNDRLHHEGSCKTVSTERKLSV